MNITGACHCGEISYEAELNPERVGICHCTDCQMLSASAYRVLAMVNGNTFRITKGTPQVYVKTAESGNRRIQAFCGTCGSGLYASEDAPDPAIFNLRMGTIHQRRDLTPRFECWLHSALPWLETLPDTQKFDGNPQ